MINIIFRIIALMMIWIGIIFIYDARILTKKFFSFGDQNEGSSGMKIFGVIFAVIGGIIILILMKKM